MPNYTLYYFNGRGRAEICRMMFAAAGVKYTDKRFEFSEWEKYRNDFPCNYLPCLEMDGGFRVPETMSICRYLARQYNFYPKSSMDMFRCDYICDCFYEIMHDYMRYFHWRNGRFRYDCMESGRMGTNMSSGMGPGMMNSNMSSGMMSPGMMGSNMTSGMMSPGMSGSNMSSGMMQSSMMNSGMGMGSNMGGGNMMNTNYDNYMQWRYMNSFNRIMPFMERTLAMRNSGSHFFMGDQNYVPDQSGMKRITVNAYHYTAQTYQKMMWCDMMFYCCMESMYMENQSMFSSYPKMMGLYKRVASHPKICGYIKSRRMTNW